MVRRSFEGSTPAPAHRRGLRLWHFAVLLPVVATLLVFYRLTAPLGGRLQALFAGWLAYMGAAMWLVARPAGWVGDRLAARIRGWWTRRGGRADVAAGMGTVVEATLSAGLTMAGGLAAMQLSMILLEAVFSLVIR